MKVHAIKVIQGEGYQHNLVGLELYIEKDGVKLKLNSDEVVEIMRACGMMSNDSLDQYKIERTECG